MQSNDVIGALVEEKMIRESRRDLGSFTRYTFPKYKQGWFNAQIDYELVKFYNDIKAGRQPRLMVFAPPRHGKSEKFSRRFPAWALGKDPDLQIIASSYSSDLSQRMNRDVQRIIDDERYKNVFPETSLNSKNVKTIASSYMRNADLFEIVGHRGAYRASGVGGGITGMGADIGIIDDPVKDKKEARSPTVQQSVYEWYVSTFYTRLSEMSGVLLGMTRWHPDDLAGRLLADEKDGADKWRVVSFPAIAEKDEYFCVYSDGETDYGKRRDEGGESVAEEMLLRRTGDPLHAERFSVDRLLDMQKATQKTGDWDALYQQRPQISGGNLFTIDNIKRYTDLPNFEYRIITADTAQKKGEHNDYSVFQHWGIADGVIYLIDIIRKRLSSTELLATGRSFWKRCKGYDDGSNLRGIHIEDKSSGTGLIQQLKGDGGIPVVAIPRNKDKLTRAYDAMPYLDSGLVAIPANAPWVSDFIGEVSAFSPDMKHAHDDQIDPMMDAIDILLDKTPEEFWFIPL